MTTPDRAAPRTEAGKRAQDDLLLVIGQLIENGWSDWPVILERVDILAIEREAAAAPAPEIDVARLALALGSTGNCGHSSCPRDTSRHDGEAAEIAAEYARLTPPGDRDRREARETELRDRFWRAKLREVGARPVTCVACGGSGSVNSAGTEPCPQCDGSGADWITGAAPGQAGPRDSAAELDVDNYRPSSAGQAGPPESGGE